MRELPHVLGIVLAGGEGKRLYPLTADRAKPATPAADLELDQALVLLQLDRYSRSPGVLANIRQCLLRDAEELNVRARG